MGVGHGVIYHHSRSEASVILMHIHPILARQIIALSPSSVIKQWKTNIWDF